MRGAPSAAADLGFEAFGTACGLAVVSGALSVLTPTLDVLTVTLVALAVAGWASLHRRDGGRAGPSGAGAATYAIPFAVLAAVTVLFLRPPGPFAPWKALLLGLGLVPLWVAERRPALLRRREGRR